MLNGVNRMIYTSNKKANIKLISTVNHELIDVMNHILFKIKYTFYDCVVTEDHCLKHYSS